MTYIEQIKSIAQENSGMVTAAQVTQAGIPRRCLTECVDNNILHKVSRGIYTLPDSWDDEMFILQHKYSKGVFSYDTALYLHGLSDRTPSIYTMTFPYGTSQTTLKNAGVKYKLSIAGNYELGIVEMDSPLGHKIKVYNVERTLCDIVKGNNACDIQIVTGAMKAYTMSSKKNLSLLFNYAAKLRVLKKVQKYMEVLL